MNKMRVKSKYIFILFDIASIIFIIEAICSLILSVFDKNARVILIALAVTMILILSLVFYCLYFFRKKPRVHKPSDAEWEELLEKTIYHLTYEKNIKKIEQGNDIIELKPTRSFSANIPVFCRPSVYFFVDKPNKERLKLNDIDEKKDNAILVEIKNLNRNKVRIRSSDNALIYIGRYKGKGNIEKFQICIQ